MSQETNSAPESSIAVANEMSPEQKNIQTAIDMVNSAFQETITLFQNQIKTFPNLNMPLHYLFPGIKKGYEWLLNSREGDNFTYALSERNHKHLASLISMITGVSYQTIRGYFNEILESKELLESYHATISKHPQLRLDPSPTMRVSRRLGWYAMARILKPKILMETGIHYGIGAMVLGLALQKNEAEGFPGKYVGVDIVVGSGVLFNESPYARYGQIYYSDSIKFIDNFAEKVDLLVVDSDHSSEYEYREYYAAMKILSPEAFILADNAHSSDALHNFSLEQNRPFAFFEEKPEEHWYPGAGIGFSPPYKK